MIVYRRLRDARPDEVYRRQSRRVSGARCYNVFQSGKIDSGGCSFFTNSTVLNIPTSQRVFGRRTEIHDAAAVVVRRAECRGGASPAAPPPTRWCRCRRRQIARSPAYVCACVRRCHRRRIVDRTTCEPSAVPRSVVTHETDCLACRRMHPRADAAIRVVR